MEHFPLDFLFFLFLSPFLSSPVWGHVDMPRRCARRWTDMGAAVGGTSQMDCEGGRVRRKQPTTLHLILCVCVSLKGWGLKWSLSMHLEGRLAGLTGWDYVWLFLLWASWLMLKLLWQILNAPWRHLKETERNHRSTLWQRRISFKPGLSAFTKVFLSRLSFFFLILC